VGKKIALIFGITGQDGAYLADLLLKKGYVVHGVKRRNSNLSSASRLDYIYIDPIHEETNLHLHYGDVTDAGNVFSIVQNTQPDEIYNLAAQSHVAVSFVTPTYTGMVDGLGTTSILEAIRILGLQDKTKFYQASTSELYGEVLATPQTEDTPFNPQSPYAIAKMYAYWMTKLYREAYGVYACNGILFNHESPLRGENFVTRKITMGLVRIKRGMQDTIFLGNLDAKRDWGHAKDYVEAMWKMLQQEAPEDFVIATGAQSSVRQFVEMACSELGIKLEWSGEGLCEVGLDQNDTKIVEVRKEYYRPAEVESLIGDASKAKRELGWEYTYNLQSLIKEMISYDLALVDGERLNPFELER